MKSVKGEAQKSRKKGREKFDLFKMKFGRIHSPRFWGGVGGEEKLLGFFWGMLISSFSPPIVASCRRFSATCV